ncbi:UNVERIFIED_CONTAM: Protein dennd6a [Siphonaria sp. JEL0065]|nr:Protein dennd6a [Siphonaria sp. JEL0065]
MDIVDASSNPRPAPPLRLDSSKSMQLLLDSIEPHSDLDDSQMEELMDDILGESSSEKVHTETETMPAAISVQVDGFEALEEIEQLTPIMSPLVSRAMKEDALAHDFGFNVHDLRRWVTAICVVTFDLDIGPALEYIYPPIELSEAELKTICFSSFPDSNSTSHLGDTSFSFRFRQGPEISKIYSGGNPSKRNEYASVGLGLSASTVSELVSRSSPVSPTPQKPDPTIRRGYFQKSLVVLSPHSWHGFFPAVLSGGVGGKVMDALALGGGSSGVDGEDCGVGELAKALVKEVCVDVASWPDPPSAITSDSLYLNVELDLTVLGYRFLCAFPPTVRFPQMYENTCYSDTELAANGLPVPQRQRTASSVSNPLYYASNNSPIRPSESVKLSTSNPGPSSFLSHLPVHQLQQQEQQQRKPHPTSILSNPSRIYTTFTQSPETTYILWELMVLGEPILIHAETPKAASQVVYSLLELMKPVPFGGDFRPYFTIQDSEFKGMGGGGVGRNGGHGVVLGVTNLFFEKLFSGWPHKVRAGRMAPVFHAGGASPRNGVVGSESPPTNRAAMGRGQPIVGVTSSPPRVQVSKSSPRGSTVKSFISSFRGAGGSPSSTQTPGTRSNSPVVTGRGNPIVVHDAVVESVTTKYKPVLVKDKKFLKDISDHVNSGASPEFLDNFMRRHFVGLTDRFLQPLNRHYELLIIGSPLTMTLSMLRSKPEVKPFQRDTFLESIKTATPNLPVTSKKALLGFYTQFLKSPNFASWLQYRSAELNREWRAHYMNVLCDSDVNAWGAEQGRQEIECVDLLLRVKEEVAQYSKYFDLGQSRNRRIFASSEVVNGYIPTLAQFVKLGRQQQVILELLPEGLRMMQ